MIKLSHSAASRYQTCPTSYKYHYLEGWRPKVQSAALLFGTAIDRALTSLMEIHAGKPIEAGKTPEDVFEYTWRFQDVLGKNTYLATCTDIVYANSDYDQDLLDITDLDKLQVKYELEDPKINLKDIYERKDIVGFANLSKLEQEILNHANWLCLRHKGLYMLQAAKDKILPNITEVLSTQAYVSLDNEEGDKVIGYADLVCRWKGYDKPVVIDFKTASREYAADSVLTSPQLTLYVHSLSAQYENTRLAGFVVLSKHLRKNKTKRCSVCEYDGSGGRHKTCNNEVKGLRCNGTWNEVIDPEAMVDIIINEIPEQTENIILDNFDAINIMIKQGIFIRNLNSCVQPWGKCPFFAKCYNGSDEGLIKTEEIPKS